MVSDVFLITVSVMHLVTYHWCWEIDCLEINEEKVSNVFCLQKRTSLVGFFSKIQKKHKAESFLKGTIYCAKATSLTIVGKQQVFSSFFTSITRPEDVKRCQLFFSLCFIISRWWSFWHSIRVFSVFSGALQLTLIMRKESS